MSSPTQVNYEYSNLYEYYGEELEGYRFFENGTQDYNGEPERVEYYYSQGERVYIVPFYLGLGFQQPEVIEISPSPSPILESETEMNNEPEVIDLTTPEAIVIEDDESEPQVDATTNIEVESNESFKRRLGKQDEPIDVTDGNSSDDSASTYLASECKGDLSEYFKLKKSKKNPTDVANPYPIAPVSIHSSVLPTDNSGYKNNKSIKEWLEDVPNVGNNDQLDLNPNFIFEDTQAHFQDHSSIDSSSTFNQSINSLDEVLLDQQYEYNDECASGTESLENAILEDETLSVIDFGAIDELQDRFKDHNPYKGYTIDLERPFEEEDDDDDASSVGSSNYHSCPEFSTGEAL